MQMPPFLIRHHARRHRPGRLRAAPAIARPRAALALCVALSLLAGCERNEATAPRVAGGDPVRGRALMAQYQCGACHAIPDVAAARGTDGPSLADFGQRSYIAGHIPNLPEPLVAWIVNPPAMVPGTRMPVMGVSEADARHMAAALYAAR
jgi:cytochrome c2